MYLIFVDKMACCVKIKSGISSGFNTIAPEVGERRELMKGRILALGLPLKVSIHEDDLLIYPSLAFFKLISTPDADPEYIKMVDYDEYAYTHAYPQMHNFMNLNKKLQIETVKVHVIVNSTVYTIQHSIMLTWLFTEFINRMELEYSPNCTPPYAPYPRWAYTTYYVADPTHSQKGYYAPYIVSGPCEKYIAEQTRDECIMTIDMAKASSQNIYAYFPRIEA